MSAVGSRAYIFKQLIRGLILSVFSSACTKTMNVPNPKSQKDLGSNSENTNNSNLNTGDKTVDSGSSNNSQIFSPPAEPNNANNPYTPTKSPLCTPESESQTFAGGDGTHNNPYLICNKDQFLRIGSYTNKFYSLVSDIDFGNQLIAPISGVSGIVLNGNNHKISGYKIVNSGNYSSYAGLIRSAYNSIFLNIKISNFEVQGGEGYQTGGFIANASYSKFYNIHASSGEVRGHGVWFIGGIVGNFYRSQIIESSSGVNVYPGLASSPSNPSYPALVHGASPLIGGSGNGHDLCIIINGFTSGTTNGWAHWPGTLSGGYGGGGTAVVIRNSFSVGPTYNQSSSKVGGIAGLNNSAHSYAGYYNSETIGGVLVANPSGTAKTTSQLKDASSYSGWNLTNVWSHESNNYPVLRKSYSAPSTPKTISIIVPNITPTSSGYQLPAGTCKEAAVNLVNIDKTSATASQDIPISFFTQKVELFSDENCQNSLNSAVISAGQSTTKIYIKAGSGSWSGYPLFVVPVANSVLLEPLIGYN